MYLRKRWIGCFLAAAALLVAALVISVGSSSDSSVSLDTEKVERAIEDSSMAQRGQQPQVSCPSGVAQKDGLEFSCTAVVAGESTRFLVTQTDGAGRVHYEAP